MLAVKAWPAIKYNGWGFFTGSTWTGGNLYGNVAKTGGVAHLEGAKFGALPSIVGTLGTSAIALIVGGAGGDRHGAGHRRAAAKADG